MLQCGKGELQSRDKGEIGAINIGVCVCPSIHTYISFSTRGKWTCGKVSKCWSLSQPLVSTIAITCHNTVPSFFAKAMFGPLINCHFWHRTYCIFSLTATWSERWFVNIYYIYIFVSPSVSLYLSVFTLIYLPNKMEVEAMKLTSNCVGNTAFATLINY